MKVREMMERFGLTAATGGKGLDREVKGGYCGDLLSEVMASAPQGCVWLTVQGHQNIVAVAVLREMAAVILTGNRRPDEETLRKADQEGIPILIWPQSAYDLAGRLYESGVGKPAAG
ncbi:MAG: DRTGG domain-containing protein [Desulfobacterales bacterium]|jgi:predicted transcriptional regulator|nr:DRTGG domain-containing protein [Desulfobacterales bacterium]